MNIFETTILIITYSTILITIFVGLLCYKRNIEKLETVAFSVSLLLLVVSMTIAHLYGSSDTQGTTHIFILLSMILVGVTTPISVMAERQHSIAPSWVKLLYGFSAVLFIGTCVAYFMDALGYLEYVVIVFLAASVIGSMILMRQTKPLKSYAHLEKTNRIFAIIFMALVPLSLLANYLLTDTGYDLKIGLVLPVVFILLAANKLMDDLQRLSLLNPKNELDEQHFDNYQLSPRERDVARLLAKGKTYKEITEELFISLPTVKTHSSNIYRKCKVTSRHELTLLLSN